MPLFARHCLKKSKSDLWSLSSSREIIRNWPQGKKYVMCWLVLWRVRLGEWKSLSHSTRKPSGTGLQPQRLREGQLPHSDCMSSGEHAGSWGMDWVSADSSGS